MKVSARTEYACMAMLQMAAKHDSNQPLRIREIAEAHDIPQRFLVQILLQLKGGGLANSTRGAAGGYRLARPPEEISLGDIVAVIDGQACEPGSTSSDSATVRMLRGTWREVSQVQHEMLAAMSLSDMLDRLAHSGDHMYYI